ncbi:MAG: hypothetical protein HKN73_19220, partial [Gemmatimonadetes bacterium]|nr:hypothetical protein [Gemmatimonadota bacterium]
GIATGRCLTDGCDISTDIIAVSAGLDNPEATAVNVTPGNYTIALENLGPGEASGTITVTITPN